MQKIWSKTWRRLMGLFYTDDWQSKACGARLMELMTRYLKERALMPPLIDAFPAEDLGLLVVIPAKDEKHLVEALESLKACDPVESGAEVVVVVNNCETDSAENRAWNRELAERAREWAGRESTERLRFHVLHCDRLPKKHAGVGLARKIGMDEACRRLERVGNPRGVIVCFDADSRCDPNYLREIERFFTTQEECQACSIYFEHPLEGDEFKPAVYEAIAQYELHLRYYVNAQQWAGFPWAFQTIGSSMAVRCDAYQEQNGMNRRRAGEDFYFLHKFTPLGRVRELTTTRVIPSPRPSNRVPFGTGKTVGDLLGRNEGLQTYNPASFRDLKAFFGSVGKLYAANRVEFPDSVKRFLETQPFEERMAEIRANVTTVEAFRVRFFRWFNAFLIMKYLHAARDAFYPDVPVEKGARWLLGRDREEPRELLEEFREMDRSGSRQTSEERV